MQNDSFELSENDTPKKGNSPNSKSDNDTNQVLLDPFNVNDDIFIKSTSDNNSSSINWIKPSNSLFAQLIVLKPVDVNSGQSLEGKKYSISISFTYKSTLMNQFFFPMLLFIVILFGCGIFVFVYNCNRNRKGRHAGIKSTPISKGIAKSSEIFLPKSEQILNVREFSNKHNNTSTSQIDVATQVNFFNSNISDNNLSNQINTNILTDKIDTFDAISELSIADTDNTDYSQFGKTRKELRDTILDTENSNAGVVNE